MTSNQVVDRAIQSLAARHGLSPLEQNELVVIAGGHIDGYGGCQVPFVGITISENGVDIDSAYDDAFLAGMFARGLLAWKTRKGFLTNVDCRNPATGRPLSGHLWMRQAAVKRYAPLLHEIYCADLLGTGRCRRFPVAAAADYEAGLLAHAAP